MDKDTVRIVILVIGALVIAVAPVQGLALVAHAQDMMGDLEETVSVSRSVLGSKSGRRRA